MRWGRVASIRSTIAGLASHLCANFPVRHFILHGAPQPRPSPRSWRHRGRPCQPSGRHPEPCEWLMRGFGAPCALRTSIGDGGAPPQESWCPSIAPTPISVEMWRSTGSWAAGTGPPPAKGLRQMTYPKSIRIDRSYGHSAVRRSEDVNLVEAMPERQIAACALSPHVVSTSAT